MYSTNATAFAKSCAKDLVQNVQSYTDDQLEALLNDDARLDALIASHPQIASLNNEREVKLAQSKSMAECNLSLEPRLRDAKTRLSQTYTEALKLKDEVEQMKKQLDAVSADRSLDSVCVQLSIAARDAEEESEKVAQQLAAGEIDVETFSREFAKKRMLYHKRKVKAEKMKQIMSSQTYNPPPASSNLPYPASGNRASVPYPATHVPPYPTGPGDRFSYPRIN